MIAEAELQEYLAEIRKQVCSHCVERPAGGPPCAPLGKDCGVELHLPALIDSIHQVHDDWIEPYLAHNREHICESCAFLHSSICPCPMDYLSVLLVRAVETVDARHEAEPGAELPSEVPDLAEIARLYTEARGQWTGCDWPTTFAKSRLDLNGCRAEWAAAMALTTTGPLAEDWKKAAAWLAQVETHARRAEAEAAQGIEAIRAGDWRTAFIHAQRAWTLELATGRPVWRGFPQTWNRFHRAVEAAFLAHEERFQ